MFFGSDHRTRSGKSNSTRNWNQAHLAIVPESIARNSISQRLSPHLVLGAKPSLQILEGGRAFLTASKADIEHHERTVSVSIRFNELTSLFQVVIAREGKEIETREGRRSQQVSLTLGFESMDGRKFRIPWRQIEKGLVWQKSIEMRESYFSDFEQRQRLSYLINSNAERLAPRSKSQD